MKERPILFSGPMVCALLAGTKTQTRRVVKVGFCGFDGKRMSADHDSDLFRRETDGALCLQVSPNEFKVLMCPYGQPGDRLWVREAWSANTAHPELLVPGESGGHLRNPLITYLADGAARQCHEKLFNVAFGKGRPSIHMPRWASRLTLEITDVRVERLRDISDADIQREGVLWGDYEDQHSERMEQREAFEALWESINGSGSWEANPWVWVVEFKRL